METKSYSELTGWTPNQTNVKPHATGIETILS